MKFSQQKLYEMIFRINLKKTDRLEYMNGMITEYHERYHLYKAFAKYHEANGGHIHLVIVLMDKPKIAMNNLTNFFKHGEYGDILEKVNLTKQSRQKSLLSKLRGMVNYLIDGHDNGKYCDTANYRYDPELLDCKGTIAKSVLYMNRGLKRKQIFALLNFEERVEYLRKEVEIVELWREYREMVTEAPEIELTELQKIIMKTFFSNKIKAGRDIMVVADPPGGAGKSFLAKAMYYNDPRDTLIIRNGKSADIAHAYNGQSVVILDLTRTNRSKINYDVIEQIADSCVFSGKYASKSKIFNNQSKFMILTNNHLDYTALSNDRWKIYRIISNKLCKENIVFEGEPIQKPYGDNQCYSFDKI